MPRNREWRVHLAIDNVTQALYAVVYGIDQDGQYSVVEETEFGPFDTTLDVASWLAKVMVREHPRPMR